MSFLEKARDYHGGCDCDLPQLASEGKGVMKRRNVFLSFATGYLVAFLLDASCSTYASRRMFGWDVTTRNGNRIICSDPVMWPSLQELECEDLP